MLFSSSLKLQLFLSERHSVEFECQAFTFHKRKNSRPNTKSIVLSNHLMQCFLVTIETEGKEMTDIMQFGTVVPNELICMNSASPSHSLSLSLTQFCNLCFVELNTIENDSICVIMQSNYNMPFHLCVQMQFNCKFPKLGPFSYICLPIIVHTNIVKIKVLWKI